jgi:hypothetical protein
MRTISRPHFCSGLFPGFSAQEDRYHDDQDDHAAHDDDLIRGADF